MASIFLTFDDGPNEPFTSQILDFLKEFGAKASFFVCGKCVERYPEIAKRIVQEGHAIGNHTYSHSKARSLSGFWGSEIEKTTEIIEKVTAIQTKLFRPPWGFMTPLLKKYIDTYGYKTVLWNVEAHDWEQPPAKVIAERVVQKVNANSVVLLHDGYNARAYADRSQTVAALPIILSNLTLKGYTFHALS